MNAREGRVEEHLKRASAWWKWQIFIRRTAVLSSLFCGALLLVGAGMILGWFDSLLWVGAWIALVALLSLFVWMVVGVLVAESSQDSAWLAGILEKSYSPLMDRLNALVYLRAKASRHDRLYAQAIEQQTVDILARAPARCPFSWRRTLAHVGFSTAMLAATAAFYVWMHPWRYVLAANGSASGEQRDGSGFENTVLEIPDLTDATDDRQAEQPAAWGEVRITQPGHDVRATRLEVVPLEIEVATNRPLNRVRWLSGRNSPPREAHELARSDQRSYAIYKPLIVPEEHQVGQADVVAYYAEAKSDSDVYASDLFFVDIVPLRDEIERMPGGRDGIASRVLDHVSHVIQWQQNVLRSVHRLSFDMDQAPDRKPDTWNTIAEDVARIREMIRHLSAQFEAAFDPARVETIVESLGLARAALLASGTPLRERRQDAMSRHGWTALGHLINARKQVYALIEEHPQDFVLPQPPTTSPDQGQPPAAGDQQQPGESGERLQRSPGGDSRRGAAQAVARRLEDVARALARDQTALAMQARDRQHANRIANMRSRKQELDNAREFVRDALGKQRNIERQANPRNQKSLRQLADEQNNLNQSVENFLNDQPVFDQLPSLCARATSAMRATQQALEAGQKDARERAGNAADALQAIDNELEKQQQGGALPEAYALKRMLEHKIEQLRQLEQRPSEAPAGQCQKTGGRCKSLMNQLRDVAARCTSDGSMGSALHRALEGENADRAAGRCDRLTRAASPEAVRQAARELRQELEDVRQAFDDSVPTTLAQRPSSGPSGAGNSQAIMRALQQFQSGPLRRASGKELEPEEQMRLRFDAFDHLIEGIRGTYRFNEDVRLLVEQLQQDLRRPDYRIDMATLAALLEHVQQARTQGTGSEDTAEQKPLVNVDPADFPAPYREAIQRYFRKLSERP